MNTLSTYANLKVAVTVFIGATLFLLCTLGVGLLVTWLSRVYQIHRTAADYSTRLEAEAQVRLALVQGGERDLTGDARSSGLAVHRIEKLRPSRTRRPVIWRREGRTPTI